MPVGFKYPELGETIEIAEPFIVQGLEGRVVDLDGAPVNKALVEVTFAKSIALQARFTDKNGYFVFMGVGSGEYHVKVTKPNFAPLRAKITVSNAGQSQALLALHPGT